MKHQQTTHAIQTRGQGLYPFTQEAQTAAGLSGVEIGLFHVFCRHTSASLLIQENADTDVRRDLVMFFRRLVPDGDELFVHTSEGPDDMPAHVKAALTQSTLTIPIRGGVLALGTWQGLFLFEHRHAAHRRELLFHVHGS